MSGEPHYMLALVQTPNGAYQPVRGRIEVRGGKVEKIEIPPVERAVWLELLIAGRVALETQTSNGS